MAKLCINGTIVTHSLIIVLLMENHEKGRMGERDKVYITWGVKRPRLSPLFRALHISSVSWTNGVEEWGEGVNPSLFRVVALEKPVNVQHRPMTLCVSLPLTVASSKTLTLEHFVHCSSVFLLINDVTVAAVVNHADKIRELVQFSF